MLSRRLSHALAALFATLAAVLMVGCASPGMPKPPSLQLPQPVSDLSAVRRGASVELRFTLPANTTEGIALKSASIMATLCRAADTGACKPVASVPAKAFALPGTGPAEMTDALPADLSAGPPRLLTYRVQLANDHGRAAGYSDAAYAAAGAAPDPVSGLQAQGSRQGALLTWQSTSDTGSKVVLRREALNPAPAPVAKDKVEIKPTSEHAAKPIVRRGRGAKDEEPNVVWLDASGDARKTDTAATLDDGVAEDEPYRYTAERRRSVDLGGHTLELRSEVSAPVLFTLRDVFPPPTPTGLSAAGFAAAGAPYAVDLIWQPVEDPHLAGYNVYREAVNAAGVSSGSKAKLTAAPVTLPAFHDVTAAGSTRWRYSVTALDTRGNESPAVTTFVEASSQ